MNNTIKKYKQLIINITYVFNFIIGAIKIILSILSKSVLLFIYAFYNIGIGIAKGTAIKKSDNYKRYYLSSIIVLFSSLFYVLYSIGICLYGSNKKYNKYVAIAIATFTFIDITFSIIEIFKSKKIKDIKNNCIKQINFASSLISMSLTQTALLSFTTEKDMSLFYGIGGVFFGSLSIFMSIYMIIYICHYKKVNSKIID